MNSNYFIGIYDEPFHLSVGTVLINEQGEVAHHFWEELTRNGETFQDIHILMRETLELNETLEAAVSRGLLEEFGATAEITTYLGSLVKPIKSKNRLVQKTTLYFLCALKGIDPSARSTEDIERDSDVQWHTPDFLVPRMQTQAKKYDMPDIDESEILQRLQNVAQIS